MNPSLRAGAPDASRASKCSCRAGLVIGRRDGHDLPRRHPLREPAAEARDAVRDVHRVMGERDADRACERRRPVEDRRGKPLRPRDPWVGVDRVPDPCALRVDRRVLRQHLEAPDLAQSVDSLRRRDRERGVTVSSRLPGRKLDAEIDDALTGRDDRLAGCRRGLEPGHDVGADRTPVDEVDGRGRHELLVAADLPVPGDLVTHMNPAMSVVVTHLKARLTVLEQRVFQADREDRVRRDAARAIEIEERGARVVDRSGVCHEAPLVDELGAARRGRRGAHAQ